MGGLKKNRYWKMRGGRKVEKVKWRDLSRQRKEGISRKRKVEKLKWREKSGDIKVES